MDQFNRHHRCHNQCHCHEILSCKIEVEDMENDEIVTVAEEETPTTNTCPKKKVVVEFPETCFDTCGSKKVRICQKIPCDVACNMEVEFKFGDKVKHPISRCGSKLYGKDLKTRFNYVCHEAKDTHYFVCCNVGNTLCDCCCGSKFRALVLQDED